MKTEREYSAPFKSFILALQRWVELDFPKTGPFTTDRSLCLQVRPYTGVGKDCDYRLVKDDLWYALFHTTGTSCFPFNENGDEFEAEKERYKNPARLAWIKMMTDKFKEEQNNG